MSNPDAMPEPSMEEILASIRQIISEGEEEPATPEARPSRAAQVAPAPKAVEPPPEPEDDPYAIAAGAEPEPAVEDDDEVFDLTDEMVSAPAAPSNPIPFPQPVRSDPAESGPARRPSAPQTTPTVSEVDEIEFRAAPAAAEAEDPEDVRPSVEAARQAQPDRAKSDREEAESAAWRSAASAQEAHETLLSSAAGEAVADAFGRLTRRPSSVDTRTMEEIVVDMMRPMLKDWLDDNLPLLVERMVRDEIERVSRGRR